MSWIFQFMDSYRQPPKPKAKLHVQWGNNTGMLAYVSLNPLDLDDAEQKIPHMMRSMEDVISLAAKRGALHNA